MPADTSNRPSVVPTATYRFQFRKEFTLRHAAALIPYLAALGVSHVYASPYLKARAGSTHGYDIIDHNALNPEIGDEADFEAFVASLRAHDMGQILDFVPNHMGVGQSDNTWWLDMLEYGDASPYARYFDVDWHPFKPELHGKVVLPVLGDHYGRILESGELQLRFVPETGGFDIRYHDHRFPIRPRRFGMILDRVARRMAGDPTADPKTAEAVRALAAHFHKMRDRARSETGRTTWRKEAERLKEELTRFMREQPDAQQALDTTLADINGKQGEAGDPDFLHRLLEAQPYRLSYWRVAAHEINYRRFFDINDLAGIRVEEPDVFEASHRRILAWIGQGKLDGLRIDHIDGLFDPEMYCARLQDRAREVRAQGQVANAEQPFYVLVEKILAPHEHLRESWQIAGTTGYEVLNLLNGLFVDPKGERGLDRTYARVIGRPVRFDDVLYESKARAMDNELASELNVLANRLDRLSEDNWDTRDYTLPAIRRALAEVITYFSVYRTYVTERGVASEDRRDIDWAVGQARKRSNTPDARIFDFIHDALTTDLVAERPSPYPRREALQFAMKFQQYTGPVTAKSMEDTAFYRYHRLASLNEVGGDPRRFGTTLANFHRGNEERRRRWPYAMVATATHDTKRGEDVRTRIDVLSELPAEWDRRVRRWATLNRRLKAPPAADAPRWPEANDEYLIYQMLVGAWPLELRDGVENADALTSFRERMEAYVTKALREAKVHSSWTSPNTEYEQATLAFLGRLLDPVRGRAFLDNFLPFAKRVATLGAFNSLSQVVLKLTIPGVPDTYQGTEFWDFSLVDPDNRRPVDYEARRAALSDLDARFDGRANPDDVRDLLTSWRDGRIKLHLVSRLLKLRRRRPDLFLDGDYLALQPEGPRADNIVAFARRTGADWAIVLAPRLLAGLCGEEPEPPLGDAAWRKTRIPLPAESELDRLTDALTGQNIEVKDGALEVASVLTHFPAAVLCTETGATAQ